MNPFKIIVACAIPAVLEVGSLLWLAFGERVHSDIHAAVQSERGAAIVHAQPAPKSRIVVIVEHDRFVALQNVAYDSGHVTGYVQNVGHTCRDYLEVSWTARAPDGTIIASSHNYATTSNVQPGERVEWSTDSSSDVPQDDRIVKVVLRPSSSDTCDVN